MARLPGCDRERRERRILQYLDEQPADGHGQDRAPLRVADHANQQFGAATAHRADQDAFDADAGSGAGRRSGRGLGHGLVGRADGVLVGQDVEPDAADVALVLQVRGDDLDRQRAAEVGGGLDRLVGRPGQPARVAPDHQAMVRSATTAWRSPGMTYGTRPRAIDARVKSVTGCMTWLMYAVGPDAACMPAPIASTNICPM